MPLRRSVRLPASIRTGCAFNDDSHTLHQIHARQLSFCGRQRMVRSDAALVIISRIGLIRCSRIGVPAMQRSAPKFVNSWTEKETCLCAEV